MKSSSEHESLPCESVAKVNLSIIIVPEILRKKGRNLTPLFDENTVTRRSLAIPPQGTHLFFFNIQHYHRMEVILFVIRKRK